MPSGRDCHVPKLYQLPTLDHDVKNQLGSSNVPTTLTKYIDDVSDSDDSTTNVESTGRGFGKSPNTPYY